MLRDWLQRKDIEAFATTLADDFGRRFPPKSEQRTDKGVKNQLASITDGLYAQAVRFRSEKRLGVYGKAKLGNVFRWQLRELGYSESFADEITRGLIVTLARRR